jgi:type IV secretory pathway protease TraF
MPNFESGVASYIIGEATVKVGFPVDAKGREAINCRQCPYLSSNERLCQLNKQPVAFPGQYVGDFCPLERKEE